MNQPKSITKLKTKQEAVEVFRRVPDDRYRIPYTCAHMFVTGERWDNHNR